MNFVCLELAVDCLTVFKSSQQHLLEMFLAILRIPPHSEYPGCQRFFLACDEDPRRPTAEDKSGDAARKTAGDFLRLERNRKLHMKSL